MEVKENSTLSNKAKKDMAYTYYTKDMGMTQKEIAARVGVSEVTMSGWVRDGDWENHRQSILVSKTKQLRAMYDELADLNTHIKYNVPKESADYFKFAQIRRQLIKDLKSLEGNVTKGTVLDVFINFGGWMQKNGVPLEKVKEVIELQDSFFKALA
jgi:transcriptional regulator with XRE-family HTH domain